MAEQVEQMTSLRAAALALVSFSACGPAAAQVLPATDPSVQSRPQPLWNQPLPEYPRTAFNAGQEGVSGYSACVDASGRVTKVDVAKSSGSKQLDDAGLVWLRSARLQPAQAAGKPVAVCGWILEYEWKTEGLVPNDALYPQMALLALSQPPRIPDTVPKPRYPPKALAARHEGHVSLKACVAPDGRVRSVARDRRGPDDLVPQTLGWLALIKIVPAMSVDGQPVGVCGFPIEYDWKLPG